MDRGHFLLLGSMILKSEEKKTFVFVYVSKERFTLVSKNCFPLINL